MSKKPINPGEITEIRRLTTRPDVQEGVNEFRKLVIGRKRTQGGSRNQ